MKNSYKLPLLYVPKPDGKWQVSCPVFTELTFEADGWHEINPLLKKEFERILKNRVESNLPIPDVMKPINTSEPFMIELLIPIRRT